MTAFGSLLCACRSSITCSKQMQLEADSLCACMGMCALDSCQCVWAIAHLHPREAGELHGQQDGRLRRLIAGLVALPVRRVLALVICRACAKALLTKATDQNVTRSTLQQVVKLAALHLSTQAACIAHEATAEPPDWTYTHRQDRWVEACWP